MESPVILLSPPKLVVNELASYPVPVRASPLLTMIKPSMITITPEAFNILCVALLDIVFQLSVANSYSGGDRQLEQATTMRRPAILSNTGDPGLCLRSC